MFGKKPKEKRLKMVCEVERDSRESFLVGTAHFFPYSFRNSLHEYVEGADHVLFEGPLDKESMARVVDAGYDKDPTARPLGELDRETVSQILRALVPSCRVNTPFRVFDFSPFIVENPVHTMTEGMKPWMAFFTVWNVYLERKGWRNSVDLEGYGIARELGKSVVFLETIDEQITVLENLSREKIMGFLKRVGHWDAYTQDYVKYYLAGDFEKLKSISIRHPSRHHSVMDRRDRVLFERMFSYLERGNTVAFVGAPHIRGICKLLQDEGYRIFLT